VLLQEKVLGPMGLTSTTSTQTSDIPAPVLHSFTSELLQDPLLSGEGSTEAYLPSEKIAIAVVVTFAPGAFDSQGNYANSSDPIFRAIGTYLAPGDAPPPVKG
jgi:hypothetical protein